MLVVRAQSSPPVTRIHELPGAPLLPRPRHGCPSLPARCLGCAENSREELGSCGAASACLTSLCEQPWSGHTGGRAKIVSWERPIVLQQEFAPSSW